MGIQFLVKHSSKITQVFLPADGETMSQFSNLVSLLNHNTVQPESPFSCILKMTGQVCHVKSTGLMI